MRHAVMVAVLLSVPAPATALAAGGAVPAALAVTAGGTAHIAWRQSDARSDLIQERRRAPDGTLTDAQYVSPAGHAAGAPRIGADNSGNAIIAWVGGRETALAVLARRRGADGSLGPVQRISPADVNASEVDMGVDPDGNATFVWRRLGGSAATVQARRRLADGTLTTIQTISATGTITTPRVGVGTSGNAVIAWLRQAPGASYPSVQVRSRSATGTLGGVQTLTGGAPAAELDLAVAPDGRSSLAWQRQSMTIQGRLRTASGTLSPTQTLSPADTSSSQPATAIDVTGRAAFVWKQTGSDEQRINGRVRWTTGGLSPTLELDIGVNANNPEVAMDGKGNALFAWSADPLFDSGPEAVYARSRSAGGVLGPPQGVSGGPEEHAYNPRIGFDANGHAVLVWDERSGAAVLTRSRRRSASGEMSAIQTLSE